MNSLPAARRATALLAASAVGLTLPAIAGSATAATAAHDFYTAQNSKNGVTVTSTRTGRTHVVTDQLRATAADGTTHVLEHKLAGKSTATVVVDDETGVARVVALKHLGGTVAAGEHHVLVANGGSMTLIDSKTGEATSLASIPAAEDLIRKVTAYAATTDGAIVATADVTAGGSSGTIQAANLWKVTANGVELIAAFAGSHMPALSSNAFGTDVLLVNTVTDKLTVVHFDKDASQTHFVTNLRLPAGTTSAAIGYTAEQQPLITLATTTGTKVFDLDGGLVKKFAGSAKVFTSATDIHNPNSVANRLAKTVKLTGVQDGSTVRFGTRVTPTGTATAVNDLGSASASAKVLMKQGKNVMTVKSGKSVRLTKNTYFTVISKATTYTKAGKPITKLVKVANRLAAKVSKKTRKATVSTTASRIRVQVQVRTGWKTVDVVKVHHHVANFKAPRGALRVVAARSATNAASVLNLAGRWR